MKGDFIGKDDPGPRAIVERAIKQVGEALPEQFTVRATKQGFWHWLRNKGDVFIVTRELYSSEWMERVPDQHPTVAETMEQIAAVESPALCGVRSCEEGAQVKNAPRLSERKSPKRALLR